MSSMKFDALGQPVEKSDIDAFAMRQRIQNPYRLDQQSILGIVGTVFILVIAGLMVSKDNLMIGSVYLVTITILLVILVPFALRVARRQRKYLMESAVRAERFANDNGWVYTYRTTDLHFPGTLFEQGDSHAYYNVIQAPEFYVGRCTFMTGTGRSRHENHYGFMIMQLDRHMPHMLLDGKSNNMRLFGSDISNFQQSFPKDQVVSLEGDFDKYFTLYAPETYGFDSRYIFTPDLMSLLINESEGIDIEVRDNQLFIYFGKYDVGNLAFWQRIEKIKGTLGNKFVDRMERYRDNRTDDGLVAATGTRLEAKIPLFKRLLVYFILICVAYQVYGIVKAFFTVDWL